MSGYERERAPYLAALARLNRERMAEGLPPVGRSLPWFRSWEDAKNWRVFAGRHRDWRAERAPLVSALSAMFARNWRRLIYGAPLVALEPSA